MSFLRLPFRIAFAGLCCAFLAFALAPASTQAQTPATGSPPSMDAGQNNMQKLRLDLIDAQLELEDGQRAKVKSILADQQKQQQALSQKYRKRAQNADSTEMEAMRQQMQSEAQQAQEQTQSRLSEVLDAGQMDRYRSLYVEPQQKSRQQRQNADPVTRILNRREAELDLADEQRAKLRPVFEQQMKQMKQLRKQARSARGDKKKMQQLKQQARQMQMQQQQKLKAVLTDAQMQKMQRIQQAQQKLKQAQQRMRRRRMQQMRQRMKQQKQQKQNDNGSGQ